MAFVKKTWLARLGTGLNKFTVNGGNKVALDSAPDTITQEGTPLSAQNMNDLEGRIETAFTGVDTDLTNLAGNFAQIETTPSTHNYSVGDLLVFNGILYKVTTAIASGDALVVGSNIQAQTVSSAIMNITIQIGAPTRISAGYTFPSTGQLTICIDPTNPNAAYAIYNTETSEYRVNSFSGAVSYIYAIVKKGETISLVTKTSNVTPELYFQPLFLA